MSYIFGQGNKFLAIIISWPLGLLFLSLSMANVGDAPWKAVFLILLAALILLPVTRQLIFEHFRLNINLLASLAIAVVCLIPAVDIISKHEKWQALERVQAEIDSRAAAEAERLAAMTPEEIAAKQAAKKKADDEQRFDNEKRRKEALTAQLLDEVKAYEMFLDQMEANFKTTNPSDADLETIRKAASTFSSLTESLNKARQNKEILSQADISYLRTVEKRLSTSQTRLLPRLRLGFRKRAGELLWEHDAYVSVSGDGNKIIHFTAPMFAANANIKAAQEQLTEILTKLRFKQVHYRWYKGADESTYYKLDTPLDAKLTYFLYGEFQDMASDYP